MSGSPSHPPRFPSPIPLHVKHTPSTPPTTVVGASPGKDGTRPLACEGCRNSKARCSFLTSPGENESTCLNCEKSGIACVIDRQPHKSAHSQSPSARGGTPGAGTAQSVLGKRRRACESCRTSKAKCIFDGDSETCKNCEKARRTCVVELDGRFPKKAGDPAAKRTRRESHDDKSIGNGAETQIDTRENKKSYGAVFPFLFSPENKDDVAPPKAVDNAAQVALDVIDRGIVSVSEAERCFSYFLNHQSPLLPCVGFPNPPSFSACRIQSPFLFLAIIAVGAGSTSGDLQPRLLDEFYRYMADLVIYRSKKRIDIVHAILIATFWTPPPEQLEDLRYSTNVHLASSLALDVTLIGPFGAAMHPRGDGKASATNNEAGHIESWRVLLACHAGCAMLALTLQRSSAMRFNEKLEKALGMLMDSEATNYDKRIVNWIRLHRIEESLAEAKDSLPSEIGPVNTNNHTTTKRLLAFSFEARLGEWRETISEAESRSESLMIEYHFIQLQTALMGMSESRQHQLGFPFTTDQLTTPLVDFASVGKAVRASKAILDKFLGLGPIDVPRLPSIVFPRLIYAMVTMIKVASTVGALYSKGAHSDTVQEDIKNMQVMKYCDRVTDMLNKAPGPRPGRSTKIIGLLTLLRRWYSSSILRADSAPKQKHKTKSVPKPQSGIQNDDSFAEKETKELSQRDTIVPETASKVMKPLSSSSGSFQSTSVANTKESDVPRQYPYLPPLPLLPPTRLPDYATSLPQSRPGQQYASPYHTNELEPASAYPDTGIYSVDNLDAGLKFVSPNNDMYSVANADDYVLDASAMGMDGIPPLNPMEESQYGFLDALLGPGSGAVPFGLVNDAMAGFGWM